MNSEFPKAIALEKECTANTKKGILKPALLAGILIVKGVLDILLVRVSRISYDCRSANDMDFAELVL